MSPLKTSINFLLLCFVIVSFSQCSSTKQNEKIVMEDLEKNTTFTLGESYYKHWVAGVKGGGSGITLFISVESNIKNVIFDSVYFRGMQSKVETIKTGYVANFKTEANKEETIVSRNEKNNQLENKKMDTANFYPQIKDDECIVSYVEENTTKYFKIKNLVEKPRDLYPSAPPQH